MQQWYFSLPPLTKDTLTNPKKRKDLFVVLIAVLAIALVVLYVIPDALILILNTALGNAILLLVAIYFSLYRNYKEALAFILAWIILSRFVSLSQHQERSKEGFNNAMPTTTTPWTPEQIRQFTKLQHVLNPHKVFDTKEIERTTSQDELAYFMANGEWQWSPEVEDLYIKYLNRNPYISTAPPEGLRHAKRLYSQGQIIQVMAQQSKEGQFLIDGVTITSTPPNPNNQQPTLFDHSPQTKIKCGRDPATPNETALVPLKTENNTTTAIQDMSDLPKLIPGFTFLDNTPCNPCGFLDNPPKTQCRFEFNQPIQLDQQPHTPTLFNTTQGLSDIWAYIWGVAPYNQHQRSPSLSPSTKNLTHITFNATGTVKTI